MTLPPGITSVSFLNLSTAFTQPPSALPGSLTHAMLCHTAVPWSRCSFCLEPPVFPTLLSLLVEFVAVTNSNPVETYSLIKSSMAASAWQVGFTQRFGDPAPFTCGSAIPRASESLLLGGRRGKGW